ncbi:hypothetical protein [Psychrobacter sp.]|uniref:hypothetical protein n=1 Tax=Psychrobacter sp. TaxID=56811 RepID=UPI0025D17D26|nr:hypothetical protein [Psychrobacter sp.]
MAKEDGIHEEEPILEDKDTSESSNEKAPNQFTKLAKYFEKPTLTTGKKSYKAVVMPMIALGFSVTFLVLNVISMISLIISDHSKQLSIWFQRIATVIFFIIPFLISPTTPLTIPQSNSIFLEIVIKFLYFYQNIVWMIQQAVIAII